MLFYAALLVEHVLVNLQVGFCHIGERNLKDPAINFYLNSTLGNFQESPLKLPTILNRIDGLHFDQTIAIFDKVFFGFQGTGKTWRGNL